MDNLKAQVRQAQAAFERAEVERCSAAAGYADALQALADALRNKSGREDKIPPRSGHISDADVQAIRAAYARGGATQQQIADDFGVSQPVVNHIVRGNTWKHVASKERAPAVAPRGYAKLTEAKVREIRGMYASNVPQRHIAAEFGVRQTCISKVICGTSWKHVKG